MALIEFPEDILYVHFAYPACRETVEQLCRAVEAWRTSGSDEPMVAFCRAQRPAFARRWRDLPEISFSAGARQVVTRVLPPRSLDKPAHPWIVEYVEKTLFYYDRVIELGTPEWVQENGHRLILKGAALLAKSTDDLESALADLIHDGSFKDALSTCFTAPRIGIGDWYQFALLPPLQLGGDWWCDTNLHPERMLLASERPTHRDVEDTFGSYP